MLPWPCLRKEGHINGDFNVQLKEYVQSVSRLLSFELLFSNYLRSSSSTITRSSTIFMMVVGLGI